MGYIDKLRKIKRFGSLHFGQRRASSPTAPVGRKVGWLFLPGARMFVSAVRVNRR
jgi:hypothetical protein